MRTAQPLRVYIGLGANLGDPAAQIRTALGALAALGPLRASALYRTEPLGPEPQPWYVNAAAELRTALGPRELLAELQRIEREAGRVPGMRWGPRALDLDLLLYGEVRIDEPGLVLPHPHWTERRFVLVPLVELAPELRDPRSGRSAAELLAALGDPLRVENLPDPTSLQLPYGQGASAPAQRAAETSGDPRCASPRRPPA